MTAPGEIVDLADRFDRNRDQYTSGNYNEAQLRQEFLNPFFAALGWDVENRQGFAEPYKEVIHEDAVKIGTATKAPDYSFRIGGMRKFFVEAKNPSVNLKEDISPAYQLRRYAWSAKLPLSILTDFDEFAVYDCRAKPLKTDKASTGRIQYLTYKDYVEQWELIASVFSKEGVLKGSFDKYAETAKGKKGTAEVDDAFLKEIESWRQLLAKNFALRNLKLSQRELNVAVQRTIDRLIFLRICEDRGIETYGRLLSLVNGERAYRRLCEYFYRADERYNSGLFHFEREKGRPEEPDELTPNLHLDDKPLKEILGNLYYPDCPYEFSVLPADILGQVYEQFLGKVIRLTQGHQAKVEDKPEVKKAGGVYYTPTYIVDYIVKNTVGKLLNPDFSEAVPEEANVILNEAKRSEESAHRVSQGVSKQHRAKPVTPREASKLRILDPACGSGSFLIGAYQYLLDWHRDWYEKDGAEKYVKGRNAPLFRGPGGDWRLSTAERKRILLNNIYGVDIDSQAVEVTKLSLLLKVLEGENEQTISQQFKMFHERALPDLGNNIKCGNSLIGPDFYEGKQLSLLDDEEKMRINAFDWKKEFKEIMDAGGFDAVIGNPPWGAEIHQMERPYLTTAHPDVADFESSQYFLLKSISLLDAKGIVGMIIPNTFALNVFARRCRERIIGETSVSIMVDLSETDVFADPSVRSMILVSSRSAAGNCHVFAFRIHPPSAEEIGTVSQTQMKASETWKEFFVKETPQSRLVNRLARSGSVLADYCDVKQGYIPYRTTTLSRRFGRAKAEEIVKKRMWHSTQRENSEYVRELQGGDVGRYYLNWSGVWVRYGEWVSTYLPISVFSGPRVLIREITGRSPHVLLATHAEGVFVHNPSVLAVLPHPDSVSPKFVLGVLNSSLMSVAFSHVAPKAKKGLFPKIIITDARRLPFPDVSLVDASDKSRHDKMVELVEQMLALHKQLPAAKTEHEKEVVQRQIEATDKQIDQLVYELYGLTEQEIKIVEGKE